jgi:ATP-dependent protease HslVU (ClpYQ) peptidase subunit
MGCDTQVSQGHCKSNLSDYENSSKVFKIEKCDNSLMGVVGLLRHAQLLQTEENLIDKISIVENKIDFKYCVRTLFAKIYQVLFNNGAVKKSNNEINHLYIESDFIFAYKDKMFDISGWGTVYEGKDYLVSGSGREFAIGVLEDTKDLSPVERITKAISIACKKDCYVGFPITIMNTKNDEVITVLE